MILAAGRGERMRPLTDHTPKPLVSVHGRPLIEHLLLRLRAAGYRQAVINLGHLGSLIEERLGDGRRFGLTIRYSPEPPGALETAGGIRQALHLLGSGPFIAVNADLWCDHPLDPPVLAESALAHLVLVPNPAHHPGGDFALENHAVRLDADTRFTFSGIGWYRPELFADLPPGRRALAPLLRQAIAAGKVTGELHRGIWYDIGTPERLVALNANAPPAAGADRGESAAPGAPKKNPAGPG